MKSLLDTIFFIISDQCSYKSKYNRFPYSILSILYVCIDVKRFGAHFRLRAIAYISFQCIHWIDMRICHELVSIQKTIFTMALTLKSLFRCKTCTTLSTQCILDEPKQIHPASVYQLRCIASHAIVEAVITNIIQIVKREYRRLIDYTYRCVRVCIYVWYDEPFTFIGIRNGKMWLSIAMVK